MAFTNIAIIGAGSGIGKALVPELLESLQPVFQITVIVRPGSTYASPSDRIKVIAQDTTEPKGLVEHLRGIDAVVMVHGVNQTAVATSLAVIEAAIEAGVKLVIPGDFGGKDTPIFVQATAHKVPVRALLEEKSKAGEITHTTIKNGAFFSLPLKTAYGIDYEAKTATIFDEGAQHFHMTTASTIAHAIVGVLRSPAQYSNKVVHIHDFYTTQREMLSIVEEETGVKFTTTTINLAEIGTQSIEALKRGERTPQTVFGTLRYAVWGKEGAADWDEKDDSEALGLTRKDLRAELKKKMEQGL